MRNDSERGSVSESRASSAGPRSGETEYLESHQEYKAKFILYLQRERRLNSREIGNILAEQKPPYSAEKVNLKFPEAGIAKQVH